VLETARAAPVEGVALIHLVECDLGQNRCKTVRDLIRKVGKGG